jgi:aminopeptidase N
MWCIVSKQEVKATGFLYSSLIPKGGILSLLLVFWGLSTVVSSRHPGPEERSRVATYESVLFADVFDVIHYDVQLEPDIAGKTVKGKVLIRISIPGLQISKSKEKLAVKTGSNHSVEFDCGDLSIDSVREGGKPLKFALKDKRLRIMLPPSAKRSATREIEIEYHGAPRRGLRFFPERDQFYTVFSTSQWMPCVDAPADRATLRVRLILPPGLTAVANGRLITDRFAPGRDTYERDRRQASAAAETTVSHNNKQVYEWRQDTPKPTYVFGFAAGRFRTLSERACRTATPRTGPAKLRCVEFRYLFSTDGARASNVLRFSDVQVRRIFRDTKDMLEFFEERAGVAYADTTYTQVLAAGGVEQEMSSFTALSETYGREVLQNERSVWLGAHELAHQWWGNMVTCRNWNHFWLNEGVATFMAAAYLEHRFGRAEYLREIETYRVNYQKVRDAGKDKALVFPDWLNPSAEDRTLVYDKGAYVLHLLREELGEKAFWAGIRSYTVKYWGKSVVTSDFQKAMEQASGRKLARFFARWIYLS